jgi:acyl-CoA dehydrogenase
MMTELPGREDLLRWVNGHPENYYEVSTNLTAVLDLRAGAARRLEMEARLNAFGAVVATSIEPAVVTLERHREFPVLVPYDAVGRRIDEVEFHPDQRRATQAAWDSGLLASDQRGGGAFEQAALFYLLSHVGEGGIACPAVCTVGLGRALANRASQQLRAKYLARVRSNTYDGALRGSQFLTEVQGGSDVGANLVSAKRDDDDDGAWRISGEKWFCSVADADLFVVTARPLDAASGTKGLGCFLVPRTLDGQTPNGFRIRQLKDKLGTRCLASAEIDFDGALGWPIGAIDEGFSVAVEELLNTSRWLNAVGSTGLMRRAYLEAVSFARHRRAFGRTIGSIPIVREQLAMMKVEEYAALSSTMALTELIDRMDRGIANDSDVGVHRFLVNVNKFQTSLSATSVVHQGIEILGGNGTIESFSVLPRLYRDSVVYESWEGTHNVLCAQVQRDCSRLGLLDEVTHWLDEELSFVQLDEVQIVRAALTELLPAFEEAVQAGEGAGAKLRHLVDRFAVAVQATTLLREAEVGGEEKRAVASLFISKHLDNGVERGFDRGVVDGVLGTDL